MRRAAEKRRIERRVNGIKFLDYLFHGKELRYIDSYFKMLNGYSPTFTSYSGGVYEMDLTRTAVNNFATHCSKLKPEITGSALKHLEKTLQHKPNYFMDTTKFIKRLATYVAVEHTAFIVPIEDKIGRLCGHLEKTLQHKPNYFMDTTKFIKRLATYVAVEHTAFIVPIEDKIGRLCGWYPLRAERCEVVEVKGQVYLRYLFANGEHGAIEFEKVGIITDFEYTDDLFGEDNRTLKPTMQLIHTQNEGIINAVKNSANIRFLAKVANMLKPEDIKKERQRFTEDNLSADNDSGMIIYDNKFSELKQVESKPYTPNALQMQNIQENVCTHFGTNMDINDSGMIIYDNKFSELKQVESKPYTPNALQMQNIQENVCTHFGTNMDILQNKFDEETWNAYYEGKIEPFAIQLSLVMSNMTFSDREIACGNAITFSANRLQYASNTTKLQVSTQLFDRALLNRNGVMDIWNMPHVEGGEKYYIRKEYTEVSEPTKLQVSTQLFDRALLNRNGVMDIWNMPHVEGGEKYYIRKEYTEVSELNNSDKEPKIIIQQVPQAGQQGTDDGKGKEPTEGEPKEPPDDGKQKEGVNNAD